MCSSWMNFDKEIKRLKQYFVSNSYLLHLFETRLKRFLAKKKKILPRSQKEHRKQGILDMCHYHFRDLIVFKSGTYCNLCFINIFLTCIFDLFSTTLILLVHFLNTNTNCPTICVLRLSIHYSVLTAESGMWNFLGLGLGLGLGRFSG